MRSVLLKVGLLVAVGLGLGGSTTQLCSRTIWVEPGGSIQAQIDAAPPGSVVRLPEGTWKESIFINKPLTLRGQGPELSVIQAKSEVAPVLWVSGLLADMPITVVVEGLTLLGRTTIVGSDGIEREAVANLGVLANGMAQVTVQNCVILETLHGVQLSGSAQARLTGVTIVGKQGQLRGAGIHLLGRSQAMIEDSRMAWLADGIFAHSMSQVMVHNSTIEHTRFGVSLRDDGQALITHTRVTDSDDAIVLFGRAQARIADCTLVRNGAGIALAEHSSAVITDNVITGSRIYGVFLTVHDPRAWFEGFLVGARNLIPGPDEPDGNRYGAVFPDDIAFLMTEKGGVYPQR